MTPSCYHSSKRHVRVDMTMQSAEVVIVRRLEIIRLPLSTTSTQDSGYAVAHPMKVLLKDALALLYNAEMGLPGVENFVAFSRGPISSSMPTVNPTIVSKQPLITLGYSRSTFTLLSDIAIARFDRWDCQIRPQSADIVWLFFGYTIG
jgi:hypothetical protein